MKAGIQNNKLPLVLFEDEQERMQKNMHTIQADGEQAVQRWEN